MGSNGIVDFRCCILIRPIFIETLSDGHAYMLDLWSTHLPALRWIIHGESTML